MGVKEDFEAKLEFVKNWTNGGKKVTNDEKLKCYGLYKQATEGDIKTEQPSMIYFESRAKWGAWKSREGMSSEEAMAEYIKEVSSQYEKYGD